MKRLLAFAVVLTPLLLCGTVARSQDQKDLRSVQSSSSSDGSTLPIPDRKIPMDLSAWKKVFTIVRITYKKDDNQVQFLLKAKRNMSFKDDGYDAPFAFLDQDNVNLVTQKNLTWEHEIKNMRMGESTRATLELPDDETLQKTKKAKAIVKGFFNK
jgi:hypothetical protein